MADEYEKTPINSVNRYRSRASYDYPTIHGIIDATPVLHAAFNPTDSSEPFPAILPMLGCTGHFSTEPHETQPGPKDIYLHGYVSSRLMKLPRGEDSSVHKVPVTIAATLLDGLVLALTPNHNSCNYRSVVAFGYASLVTEEAEKLYAMELITENMLPGRWANSRVPPSQIEMTTTSILRVRIHSASAKSRIGGPGEDRNDLKNDALRAKVWTGVVPAWLHWGQPIPAEGNKADEVPGYLQDWAAAQNASGESTAMLAVNSEDA